MSTIPNQVSSERSTAQTMDVSTGAHGHNGTNTYTDNPTTGEGRRVGPSGGGVSYRRDASTSSEREATDYHSYGPPGREPERAFNSGRPDRINSHVSYGMFSPPNPANSTQTPPPLTSNNTATLPAPLSAHPQHPPIATLDSTSPVEPPHPPATLKAMYDSPHHVSSSQPATSPTTPSAASPSTSTSQQNKDSVKRTKTSRACDPCRRKKIRQVRPLFSLL